MESEAFKGIKGGQPIVRQVKDQKIPQCLKVGNDFDSVVLEEKTLHELVMSDIPNGRDLIAGLVGEGQHRSDGEMALRPRILRCTMRRTEIKALLDSISIGDESCQIGQTAETSQAHKQVV